MKKAYRIIETFLWKNAYAGIILKRVIMRSVRLVLLFLFFFSCRGKIQQENKISNKDTALKILIWGLPDRDQEIAMELAAKNFGFEYHRIGGCIISKNLYDSALKVNEKSSKILQARFGNNWKIQIERKIHEIRDSIAQARLDNDSSKAEVIGPDGKSIDFSKDPTPPPPAKEALISERIFNKKKGIVKIVKDCCTAEDSLEPKPPFVKK
jgi:hypothetical protein